MSDLILPSSPLPLPQTDVVVRPGRLDDVPFLDALQKLHTKQVGWMPTQQFVGKIELGHVLIAEAFVGATHASPGTAEPAPTGDACVAPTKERVGYCIGNDQYFKRDDVGIIYQMNVLPGKQRAFVGATLLKAMFERSAYGCKLFCCWCAQDIAANRFWEAMGFVPLAFRAGSEKKSRTHIFWQKRIRQGDVTTPWWFPSKTAGGSLREDRIVLPIPPGTHWSDAKPMIFPELPGSISVKALNHEDTKDTKKTRTKAKKEIAAAVVIQAPPALRRNGLTFDIPQQNEPLPETIKPEKPAKRPKAKVDKIKRVCDPRQASAARELRDRWLDQINSAPLLGGGKYEVSRRTSPGPRIDVIEPPKLLAA